MRVVSLLPSATEIICALGAESELVGVSHECDFPESIRDRTVLTSARISGTASSGAIDRAVRQVIDGALSIYAVDEAKLGALEPDLIVTQDLCDVCAVSLDDVRRAVSRLAHRDAVDIVSLHPTRLEHVWGDIETVAHALGRSDRGVELRHRMAMEVERIADRAAGSLSRPRVVTVEWLDPIMLGGTWMPELIELAGGRAVGARAGEPAPTVSLTELAALRPDVVLVKPCGFTLERTSQELDRVGAIASAAGVEARVYLSDGNAFFNRPGPRLLDSLEIMAACVDPSRFADAMQKHCGSIRHFTRA